MLERPGPVHGTGDWAASVGSRKPHSPILTSPHSMRGEGCTNPSKGGDTALEGCW